MNTILLIEDEPCVMEFLRHMLKQYDVFEAGSAEHALQLFTDNSHDIDLLIADVTLPTSSGIQVALLLRSQIRDLPVILTSGYPVNGWGDPASADLKRLGAQSVTILQKPFLPQEFRDAVHELIGSPLSEKTNTALPQRWSIDRGVTGG